MSPGEIAAIIGVCLVALGLIGTWVKNGRASGREHGGLNAELTGINNKLSDENYGLSALGEKINDMQKHCASVTAGFSERIKGVEDDVKEIKKRKR